MTDSNDPYAAPGGEHPQQHPTQPVPPASSATPPTPPSAPGDPYGPAAPPAGYAAGPPPSSVPQGSGAAYPSSAGAWPAAPQPGPPYGAWPYPVRRTNGLAVASLVLGILWLYWVGSVLALIFGYVALSQIKKAPASAPQDGRGLAIAGVVLGWVGAATLALMIFFLAVVSSAPVGY
ncbi:DUF4190 domain-containing protein [Isoptericola sp. AK164]|uniref:DUF4190 domain-containing protein n=1 Tax=Isoptericola sp. AK164 TaxID=3024246 RepID=UPI0024186CDA|nr:DUF4190 domain-containing protein [Isoptericola sp. AK164]